MEIRHLATTFAATKMEEDISMSQPAAALATLGAVRLDRLTNTLDRLPRQRTPEVIKQNLSFVGELGEPTRLVSLLRSIIAEPELLTSIADRSYRHVNHFDKLVLIDSGDRLGYRLTLHLWQSPYREDERDDELIHDHRFSFWSNVLVGTLRSQNFMRSGAGRQYRQYRYVPEKWDTTTTANFYEFVGEAGLMGTSPSTECAGGTYFLAYHRIHRVVLPQDGMTCTLVLRGPRERDHSNVFNTTYPSQDTSATNVMFTPRQVANKLTGILAEMEKTRVVQP